MTTPPEFPFRLLSAPAGAIPDDTMFIVSRINDDDGGPRLSAIKITGLPVDESPVHLALAREATAAGILHTSAVRLWPEAGR